MWLGAQWGLAVVLASGQADSAERGAEPRSDISSGAASALPSDPDSEKTGSQKTGSQKTGSEETRRAEASAALAEARALIGKGAYEEAIAAFERALSLRPSPGLHYNIAVCHHRLMLAAAPKSATYEQHRGAAVDSYNNYLRGAPDAADRYAVANTVAELGGRPQVLDEWRIEPTTRPGSGEAPELRDDATLWPEETPAAAEGPDRDQDQDQDAPPDGASSEARGDPDEPPPAPPAGRPLVTATEVSRPFPRGAFGLAFAADLLGFGDARDSDQVTSAPSLGPVLWGRAYLGKARAFGIGGELAWSMQPDPRTRQHRVSTTQLSLTGSWRKSLGPAERVDLGAAALLGIVAQSLRHRGDSPTLCRLSASGAVSGRGGVTAALRLQVAVALDPAKRHQLTLRTGPGVGSFSDGVASRGCDDLDPFAEVGLNTQALLFRTDVGYAFRW